MTNTNKPLLKIGFILDGGLSEPDGVQQYILTLGSFYKSCGHKVVYIVAGEVNYGQADAVSLNSTMAVRSNGNRLTIPILPVRQAKIRQFLKDQQFDVLHIQAPYNPVFGERFIYLASKNTAIIGTFHVVPNGWLLNVGNFMLGAWSRLSIKRFDKIISVSDAAARVVKRDFGVKTEVIPNPINYPRFKKAKPLAGNDNCLNILFLGRLVKRKGCLDLIKAIYILSQTADLPPFKLIICGKGPLRTSLDNFVTTHNLHNVVEFKGFVSEEIKPRYYASADITVFPASGGESFGIVLLEAMASGRSAVIAADNEGYKTVLKHQPEQLFPTNNPAALASRIEQLMLHPKLRADIAASGSAYAAKFDVKLVGGTLLDFYYKALLKKRS